MHYYVNENAQSNGDHEVHEEACSYLPKEENRIDLGDFAGCAAAVSEAREYFTQVNGCVHCSEECHTG